MTRFRGLGALVLAALGLVAIVLLVRDAGVAIVLDMLARSGAWLPIVLALELAAMIADACAARSLHGAHGARVAGGTWARSTVAAYVSAQCLPGGRALGEVFRAVALGDGVGRSRSAVGALFLHGGHVLAGSLVALLAAIATREDEPLLAGLAFAVFAWTLVLGTLLVLAPRSTRLTAWLARRAGLGALEPSDVTLEPAEKARALGWLVVARALHLTQAGVVVACVVGHASVVETFAAEAIQLTSASLADAVPGQTGVLEGAFRTFAASVAPGIERAEAARAAVTIAILLRVARVALASLCGLAALAIGARRAAFAAASACILLSVPGPTATCAQDRAHVTVHQRLVGQVQPTGAEHLLAIGARTSLDDGTDFLRASTYVEAGAISYVSPVYAMTGGYVELSPLSFLVLRAEATSVGLWPIGMDGAGFYPVDDYGADIQAASLPGAAGERATGVNVQLGMVLQAAVQLGLVRPIVWSQLTIEYERLGEQAFHYSPRYGAILAREDWMVASSSLLLLEVALTTSVRLRVGVYDDVRAVPSSGWTSNVVGPVMMLALVELDRAVPELMLLVRGGAHFDETNRAGEWTGVLGVLVTYDAGT